MAVVTKEQASKRAAELFNKGFSAFERGNVGHAISLLSDCVTLEPGFLQARKFLRAAEIAAARKRAPGAVGKAFGRLGSMIPLLLARGMLSAGKAEKAMQAADKLLTADPLNPSFALLFARAAAAGGYPEAAVQTLEIIEEHHRNDADLLTELGKLHMEIGNSRAARECFERLAELRPNDPAAIKLLKDATALESMASDGWTSAADGGSYRDIIRDEGEAVTLEKQAKAVRTDKDTESLIEDTRRKIEAEPDNVNYYRALARLYSQNQRPAEAVATLEVALKASPGDPELDNALTKAQLAVFDKSIADLKAVGDDDAAAAKEHERRQFEFDNLRERVSRYPNDPALRFQWGVKLFENDYFNEAIEQFQAAQRNPKHRVRSLYYLGMAFRHKQQFDLARDQLEAANAELPDMDDTKKHICYELGEVYEQIGDKEKAAACFKQVYQADITFRDIAGKIESLYGT